MAGFKAPRETWTAQIEASRNRPVLLVDEAQEVPAPVLAELRILASTDFDSRSLLTVVLAGDGRLTRHFRHEDLLPIASRIRVRLHLGYLQPEQLLASLDHLLEQAGRPDLLTPEVRRTLAEHAAGNLRILLNMANDLLDAAARRRLEQIDAKLYFELFNPKPAATSGTMTDARQDRYVREVLTLYRQTPGTRGRATTADRRLAEDLHRRGVPADLVRAALLLAAARRTARPSDAAPLQTVNSLHYFLPSTPRAPATSARSRLPRLPRSRACPSNHQRPGRPPSKSLIMAPSFSTAASSRATELTGMIQCVVADEVRPAIVYLDERRE